MTDQKALIRRAQSGDGEAFEQLLETHYDMLYRFAYKWCGNRADAEDVTQLVCVKLARTIGQFRFESSFSSWLYRVVVNCARDWARSERRQSRCVEQDETDRAVEGSVEHQAFLWQLLRTLDALPDGTKETLLLVHAEGLTHREAARILDVKESTVSWRLHEFRKNYSLELDEGVIRGG
ncbi:MAG: RNA polymerase sigma factor [Xanthomonadales bacterium]|nr:RNA polymerase sigma factor [Xanthomonadales bacterium]